MGTNKDYQADILLDLPPSAKLVLKVLEHEGMLTQKQISLESRLPQRTVRHALGQLEDHGIVRSEKSFMDARQRHYYLNEY